jgi:hypothetical protein
LLASDETIAFDGREIVHLDCQRPRELTYEERALLFKYCWEHEVAECLACGKSFREQHLAADLFDHRTHLCPGCHSDLTVSVREHLFACGLVPTEVRWRAEDARDAARRLIKQRHLLLEQVDALTRQAESAIVALRDAISRLT